MERLFEIIYEEAGLLVINKPAGLVCHPTKNGEYSSLIGRVRLHLAQPAAGNPHPHLVNRLDRETSGVTLVATNDETARELRRLWENRQVEKDYMAIVHGHVSEPHGFIDAPLGKDEQSRVAIKDCVRPDGSTARTEYWVERRFEAVTLKKTKETEQSVVQPANRSEKLADMTPLPQPFTLLRVALWTGRKHQIRIHMAHLGHPIVGDKLYGGDEDLYLALVEDRLTEEQRHRLILPYHALHACEVRFTWRGQRAVFRAEPEPWFTEFLPPHEPGMGEDQDMNG